MNCKNCGTALDGTSKFCYNCGASVAPAQAQYSTNAQPERPQGNYTSANFNNLQNGNQQIYMNGQISADDKPRRCKTCKTVFHEGNVCPSCHSANVDYKPDLWMGILALVFGCLGGWLGLVFGILGIKSANKTGYKTLKTMCIIAIPVCVFAMLFWMGLFN